MNFADLAGAPPKSSFADYAGPAPARASSDDGRPDFQFDDAAEFRASLVRANRPDLVAAFDKQYSTVAPKGAGAGRGTMPASAYQPPEAAAPAPPVAATKTTTNIRQEAPADPMQVGAAIGSSALGALAGGGAGIYAGLKSLMSGEGASAAAEKGAEAVTSTQQALTHVPRNAEDRRMVEAFNSDANPLNWPAVAGQWAGGKLADVGMPGAGAVVAGAGAAAPMLLGLGRGRAAASETSLRDIANGTAPRVEPTMGPPSVPATPAAAAPIVTREPGAAPTVADASPQLQQAVAAAGSNANPAIVARHVEAETLPVPGKLTEGQATQDPVLISREMNGRGKEKPSVPPQFYQQQGQTLAANMDAIRGTAAPDVPTSASIVDHGQTLLDAYKAKDAAVTADISAKYQALSDANGGSLPVNGADFVAAADAALAKQMKGRYVPKEIAADMDGFREGGPMSFENFENLRTNLAAESRKAERAGDGNAAGAINIVRSALESLPMSGETAAIKPLADAARSAAKARFDAIRADPAYKAAVNDGAGIGQPSPAADRFFNSFVRDGARENVARMRANLQENPQAMQTMAAGTLDHLKAQLKADPVTGNFSQAAYNKALGTLGPKMASLVDATTAQQLQAVGGFAKNAQTQPRGSFVNNSNTAVELAAQGAKAAAEHGTNMLFGGVPVGTVVRKVGGAVADTVGARKASNNALAPGAGLTRLSDLMKE